MIKTKDLGFAAYLYMTYPLTDIERKDEIAYFVYDEAPGDETDNYYLGRKQVAPAVLVNALKQIKRKLYGQKDLGSRDPASSTPSEK